MAWYWSSKGHGGGGSWRRHQWDFHGGSSCKSGSFGLLVAWVWNFLYVEEEHDSGEGFLVCGGCGAITCGGWVVNDGVCDGWVTGDMKGWTWWISSGWWLGWKYSGSEICGF